MMQTKRLILGATLLLAGCLSHSDIQAKYSRQESICQDIARATLEKHADDGTDASSTRTVAGKAFSECMTEKGWKVATPGDAKKAPTAAAVAPAAAPAAPAVAPAPVSPVSQAPVSPVTAPPVPAPAGMVAPTVPSVAPSNSTASTPRISTDPSWTTYQPARPDGTPAPEYGRGAGRNF